MADKPSRDWITPADAGQILKSLDRKQVEVLDLLLAQRTSKEIARELGIAPNTVDMRVKALKERFDLPDRADLVRLYAFLLDECGRTTCGPVVVDQTIKNALQMSVELPAQAVFTVKDSLALEPPYSGNIMLAFLEASDRRFGKFGRLALVLSLAIGLSILVLLILAVANTLGEIV